MYSQAVSMLWPSQARSSSCPCPAALYWMGGGGCPPIQLRVLARRLAPFPRRLGSLTPINLPALPASLTLIDCRWFPIQQERHDAHPKLGFHVGW